MLIQPVNDKAFGGPVPAGLTSIFWGGLVLFALAVLVCPGSGMVLLGRQSSQKVAFGLADPPD
jgi:hypothetical protein